MLRFKIVLKVIEPTQLSFSIAFQHLHSVVSAHTQSGSQLLPTLNCHSTGIATNNSRRVTGNMLRFKMILKVIEPTQFSFSIAFDHLHSVKYSALYLIKQTTQQSKSHFKATEQF
jgi:hypothetical protein